MDLNNPIFQQYLKTGALAANQNTKTNQSVKDNQPSRITVCTGQGPPEENLVNPPNGALYVEETTADAYLYAVDIGWVALNGWCPDIGEEDPSKDNPNNPETGDLYVNILTADLFYFVEGFGWVLVSGVAGPPGPAGPPGFADVFVTRSGKSSNKIKLLNTKTIQTTTILTWDTPDFQDGGYQLLNDNQSLKISNCRSEPVRYQVQVKLNLDCQDTNSYGSVELSLLEDNREVPGSLSYLNVSQTGKHSIYSNAIVEVQGSREVDLKIVSKATGQGKITIIENSSWQVTKLG